MKKESFLLNWDSGISEEKQSFVEVLSLPVIEMSNEDYYSMIKAKWFSDEDYSLIKKHRFSLVIENSQTGEKTAIRTFGARFPMMLTRVA